MDKTDVILWVLSGGFSLMLIMWHTLNKKIESLETKVDGLDKNVQQINTKTAVIESKLGDISNNVTHLMWHHQSFPN